MPAAKNKSWWCNDRSAGGGVGKPSEWWWCKGIVSGQPVVELLAPSGRIGCVASSSAASGIHGNARVGVNRFCLRLGQLDDILGQKNG